MARKLTKKQFKAIHAKKRTVPVVKVTKSAEGGVHGVVPYFKIRYEKEKIQYKKQ